MRRHRILYRYDQETLMRMNGGMMLKINFETSGEVPGTLWSMVELLLLCGILRYVLDHSMPARDLKKLIADMDKNTDRFIIK